MISVDGSKSLVTDRAPSSFVCSASTPRSLNNDLSPSWAWRPALTAANFSTIGWRSPSWRAFATSLCNFQAERLPSAQSSSKPTTKAEGRLSSPWYSVASNRCLHPPRVRLVVCLSQRRRSMKFVWRTRAASLNHNGNGCRCSHGVLGIVCPIRFRRHSEMQRK